MIPGPGKEGLLLVKLPLQKPHISQTKTQPNLVLAFQNQPIISSAIAIVGIGKVEMIAASAQRDAQAESGLPVGKGIALDF